MGKKWVEYKGKFDYKVGIPLSGGKWGFEQELARNKLISLLVINGDPKSSRAFTDQFSNFMQSLPDKLHDFELDTFCEQYQWTWKQKASEFYVLKRFLQQYHPEEIIDNAKMETMVEVLAGYFAVLTKSKDKD